MNTRNIIVVAGPSATGKTWTLNILRNLTHTHGIPFEFRPHSDSHTIFDRMLEDDNAGGYNHYHEWCPQTKGHRHRDEVTHPHVPFTLAGNYIADAMGHDFFSGLMLLPYGRLQFAEWSGGDNTNHRRDPASETDLSFLRQAERLRSGELPSDGLQRVLTVIHPITPDGLRLALNDGRFSQLPTEQEQDLGTRSWPLGESAMRIFGRDDFHNIEHVLTALDISVIHIYNDGGDSLQRGLEQKAPALFESLTDGEGKNSMGKELDRF